MPRRAVLYSRRCTTCCSTAWTLGDGDPAAVTLSSRHPFAALAATELIDQRIDHVLVRAGHPGQRLDIERVVVAGAPIDGLHPSDRLAVVCDVASSES
jgi:hypothetical protein